MKPTEAQVQEFWKWCGWKEQFIELKLMHRGVEHFGWIDPVDNIITKLPCTVDLNNLFKYAVPKIPRFGSIEIGGDGIKWYCLLRQITKFVLSPGYVDVIGEPISVGVETVNSNGTTPELALFWAIWKVIKEKE